MKSELNIIPKRSGIDWVVCAAGKSERFKRENILVPKPLLVLSGTTMLERSLRSLEMLEDDRLIIISQLEDAVAPNLESRIRALYPWIDIHFIEITHSTSGQLETAMKAEKLLRKDRGIAIWNCDTYFSSSEFINQLRDSSNIDGIIPCFKAKGNSWSYVKYDESNVATQIAEKNPISNLATVGLYYFSRNTLFIKEAKALLKKNNQSKEVYVSALYQSLIQKKFKFKIVNCDIFLPFGTPDQVKKYWKISTIKLIKDNPPGTIIIDLDNTITIDNKSLSYDQKRPRVDVIKKMKEYKKLGFKIIIYTARNMQTQQNDEAMAIGNIGAETISWLLKHEVPFDGIRFGKPYARNAFYVDDKAIRPDEFLNMSFKSIVELTK